MSGDTHEALVFLHPTEQLGWTGEGFSDDVAEWLKFVNVDEFGEYQITLSSLDVDYRPAYLEIQVRQIEDGPSAGMWGVFVYVTEANLTRNAA